MRWAIRVTDEDGPRLLEWRFSSREEALAKLRKHRGILPCTGSFFRLVRLTTKRERLAEARAQRDKIDGVLTELDDWIARAVSAERTVKDQSALLASAQRMLADTRAERDSEAESHEQCQHALLRAEADRDKARVSLLAAERDELRRKLAERGCP